jgi:hypothetical protein
MVRRGAPGCGGAQGGINRGGPWRRVASAGDVFTVDEADGAIALRGHHTADGSSTMGLLLGGNVGA